MKTISVLLSALMCFSAYSQNKDLPTDRDLLYQASQDRESKLDRKKTATSQPAKTKEKVEKSAFKKSAPAEVYKGKDFDKEDLSLLAKERGPNQVTVKGGWMSYPLNWKSEMKKREKFKDGVLFEGPKITNKDGKTEQGCIYYVDDLICDVPDFEYEPGFGLNPESDRDLKYNSDRYNFDPFGADRRDDNKDKKDTDKKKRKRDKADELEDLLKALGIDAKVIKT